MENNIKPLFKWAGSKVRMLDRYERFFSEVPMTKFVDMFAGTTTMSLWIHKNRRDVKEIVINEFNENIYNIYIQIRDNVDTFINHMDVLSGAYLSINVVKGAKVQTDRKALYEACKGWHNVDEHNPLDTSRHDREATQKLLSECLDKYLMDNGLGVVDLDVGIKDDTLRAAVMYFMMRVNFNGIWCEYVGNKKYRTPFGTGTQSNVYSPDVVREYHQLYARKGVTIINGDFGSPAVRSHMGTGVYLYADPPYVDSFTTYTSGGFDLNCQKRLVEMLTENSGLGGLYGFSNKKHELFTEMFGADPKGRIEEFDVTYTAGVGDKSASATTEILAHNYEPVAKRPDPNPVLLDALDETAMGDDVDAPERQKRQKPEPTEPSDFMMSLFD